MRLRHLPVALAAVSLLGACSTTIDESAGTTTSPSASTSTTAFTVPSGTADELLPQLLAAMTGLSALIGPAVGGAASDGASRPDKERQLVEIEALWSAARAEVESTDALVARQIDGLVAMSRVAVERNRPADADKAARFLRDVLAAYANDPA